jgi:Ca2+-binding RTX toxin-like protein
MPGEMIINANENLNGLAFGQPWGIPLFYNGQYGLGWRAFIGGHGIAFSAETDLIFDQDGVLVGFTVTFDGNFTVFTNGPEPGQQTTTGSGTMPPFSYTSTLSNGDFAQPDGGGGWRLGVHGSPNAPFPPLGPFGELVANLDRMVFNGSGANNHFDGSYMETNTVMNGGGGEDLFWGAFRHANSLSGGEGNDTLTGQGRGDTLDGGIGNDYVQDGDSAGDPTLPPPQDFYSPDTLRGGEGDDYVISTGGGDLLDGGAGQDIIQAGSGLREDADTLIGGAGDDTMNGGGGTDTAVFSGNRSQYTFAPINDAIGGYTVAGPDGTDEIRFIERLQFDDGTFSIASLNAEIVLSSRTAAENAPNRTVVGTLTVNDPSGGGFNSFSLLDDGGGRFALVGNQLVVASGIRLDYEQSQGHQVTVRASAGNGTFFDQVVAITVTNVDPDNVTGTLGNDSIHGGALNDTLVGNHGDDTLVGGGGDDELMGQWGIDVLEGGSGVDRYWGSATDWNGDRIVGYEYGETIAFVLASLSPDDYRLRFNGTDTLLEYDHDASPGFDGAIVLSGQVTGTIAITPLTQGFDVYAGLVITAADAVYGGQGDDAINDTSATTGRAYFGLRGNDEIVSGTGDDTIHGGAGNDLLAGFLGNDTLIGGEGNDRLTGQDGVDVLTGGGGEDIFGGSNGNWGGDRITDYEYGEKIQVAFGSTSSEHYRLRHSGSDTFIDIDFNRDGLFNTDVDGSIVLSGTVTGSLSVTSLGSGTLAELAITQVAGPTITSNGGGDTAAVSVAENSASVTTVTATSSDPGATLTYSISGGADASHFTINATTGALAFLTSPNYEAPTDAGGDNVYNVTVQAADGNRGIDTQSIGVAITNANDPVQFTPPASQTASVGQGIAITGFTVSDEDADSTVTTATLTVEGNLGSYITMLGSTFGIQYAQVTGSGTGQIVVQGTLPQVQASLNTLGYGAYDATPGTDQIRIDYSDGGPSTTTTLQVNVVSSNSPPTITSNGGGEVAELMTPEHSAVFTTMTATDPDAGQTLTYSISGTDASFFAINASTGELAFVTEPDFEVPADAGGDNVYDLTVQVSDGQGGFDTQVISVSVTDENDPAVITSNGGGDTAEVTVSENVINVTTVTATDQDGDAITYSIGNGDASKFSIDPVTGVLTFLSPPDFEQPTDTDGDNVYRLRVTASDGNRGIAIQTVRVVVTDVEENSSPLITSDGGGDTAAVSVAENTTALTTVTATDPDGGPLTYSITGGADASRFTIDPTTGTLAFVAPPDFEAPTDFGGNNVYEVTVQVEDESGATDSQSIAVTVSDVAVGPPQVSNAPLITGSAESESLTGQGGNNTLRGLDGNDTMDGGGGNDTIEGGSGNDSMIGGAGNDLLDGGTGNDAMAGGANNDTYVVDSTDDTVTEASNGGTDLVRTILSSFTLGTNVENLTFTGTGPFQGTGNSQSNVITGGSDGDTLDGGSGIDRMVGLGGNDTYRVDNTLDMVEEAANGGIDTVITTAARYVLAANVENLTYSGTGRFTGTGNASANTITGGSNADIVFALGGNDVLSGLGGNDTLNGGAGDDTFLATISDGNDRYVGGDGRDTYSLAGTTAAATVNLLTGTSTSGQTGSDVLDGIENAIGGSGADRFVAGNGLNFLTGGGGNDTFAFTTTAAAGTGANRDQVTDFVTGDRLDVSGIDASAALGGNNAFSFAGQIGTVVNGVGQLAQGQIGFRFFTDAAGNVHTIIEGNVNANTGADFQIDLWGQRTMTSADFIL